MMFAFRFAATLAALFALSDALAGSFSVAPVRLDVRMPRRAVSFEVQNTGDRPAQIQVERYRWVADNGGDDQLEPTEDVIATPPIFTLSPGQKQIVRVLVFGAQDPAREGTYRVILQETPLNDPPPNAVRALLRISMPLFITPQGAKPDIVWTAGRDGERWSLTMENVGNAHAQITAARTGAGESVDRARGYLLPGEKRRVTVDSAPDTVSVKLNDQLEQTFPVRPMP
jgi:fimbrial chaperone protein